MKITKHAYHPDQIGPLTIPVINKLTDQLDKRSYITCMYAPMFVFDILEVFYHKGLLSGDIDTTNKTAISCRPKQLHECISVYDCRKSVMELEQCYANQQWYEFVIVITDILHECDDMVECVTIRFEP